MTTDLTGAVFKSADKRETRYVRVQWTDASYAYVIGSAPDGVPHTNGRRSRILLDGKGGLRGYRRVEEGR